MTTNAKTSQGVQLKRGDGATPTEAFTLVAEITSFDGPQEKAKQIDVSSLDSSAHEYIGGLVDGGEVKVSGNFIGNNVQQQGLRADLVANPPIRRNFKLILTDGSPATTYSFAAVVIEFAIKGEVDKQLTFSAALKISGLPTIAYAT